VAGFHVEYSGMRFAIFFLAEYANMFTVCAIATTMFLGGWAGPGPEVLAPFWFLGKTFFLLFVMLWLRWSLARVRVDQLMYLGWKVLLPIAFANLILTGVAVLVV
jgi:NADH-quinone oxidoreductase subunit H